jgi:plastocyanin
MLRQRLVIIIVALALIIAGGVFSIWWQQYRTSSGATASDTSNTSNADSAAANKQTVTIHNHSFSPSTLTVKKGAMVTWSNQDTATHAIAEKDGATGPRSPQLPSKATYTYTFTATGTYHYYCVIHPDMTGTVTVTD